MNIIVAEDDPFDNRIITQILINLGHEVRTYQTGDEAWAAFQEQPADVIVSDWIMAGLGGLDFCIRLRELNLKNYVYFIMVTGGRTNASDHDVAAKAGVDDFLIKPVSTDQIWRRLFVAKRILDFTTHIKQLRALLPTCTCCKKTRTDGSYWRSFEAYIDELGDEDSTFYVCPACQEAESLRAARAKA